MSPNPFPFDADAAADLSDEDAILAVYASFSEGSGSFHEGSSEDEDQQQLGGDEGGGGDRKPRAKKDDWATVASPFNTGFKTKGLTGRRPITIYLTCDEDLLSAHQCFVRRNLVFLEATEADVEANAQGRNKPIAIGQVGVGCRFCVQRLEPAARGRGAVYFPSTLAGIYQASQHIASSHLCHSCNLIPLDAREKLVQGRSEKSSSGGGKRYWGKNAAALGVYTDDDGLRFHLLI